MKLTLLVIALTGLNLIASPGQAARADISLYGAGAQTCAVWKALREEDASQIEDSWIAGYLTAVQSLKIQGTPNSGTVDIAAEVGHTDGVIALMNKFCAAHPDSTIYAAAEDISDQLAQKWLNAHPPLRPSR